MSWWVVAWRNLWRNRKRTYVTLATIAACSGVLVMFQGLLVGMLEGTVANLTDVQLGQVQIHHDEYRKRPSMYRAIDDAAAIVAWADERGIHAAPRSYGAGLVGHGDKSAGAQIWGVDPQREKTAFKLPEHVKEGDFLAEDDPTGAVIGVKLARTIGAQVGDELIVLVAAADGSIGNELWRVRGVLDPMGDEIDRSAVMVGQATFAEIFVSGGRVHEIALNSRPGPGGGRATSALELEPDVLAEQLGAVVAERDEVATWRQLMPTMAEMVQMSGQYNKIFALVFFLAAALGILNTMLMAAYERIPEMGLVKALGASPWRVFTEMSLEVLMLSGLGAFMGMILGGLATIYFQANGIDTRSWGAKIEMSGVVWDPIWRAQFDWRSVVGTPLSLIPIAMLAGLYPALTAARVEPIKALRRMT